MVADIDAVARQLLDCACQFLEDAARPACQCYPTIGPPVVGPCCTCDEEGSSGNLTINFETMYPADANTLERVVRVFPCRRGGTTAADFTLVLTRCYPTLGDDGQLPAVEDIEEAAHDLHVDGNLLYDALTCCPDVRVRWRDLVVDSDPEGGCSIIAARITVDMTGSPDASR